MVNENNNEPIDIYDGYVELGSTLIKSKTDINKGLEYIKIGINNTLKFYGVEKAELIIEKYNLNEIGIDLK